MNINSWKKRRHKSADDSLSLFLVAEGGEAGFLRNFSKQTGEYVTVASSCDETLENYLARADHIYLSESSTPEAKRKVLSCCFLEEKRVYLVPEIFDIAVRNAKVACIGDTPVFAMDHLRLTKAQAAVKRLEDLVLSLLGIVITLPLFLFVTICIKCCDGGPVFYAQERSGLRGKPFKMIKFRSMVVDAEKETGAVFAKENDCRITKIGRFLRASRIDEIPQFFNILAGSMSLVGPRPERPVFVEEYSGKFPEYRCRMQVKPGLTGLAQVKGRYTTSVKNKIKFDLMYIMNYSLWLDIKILAETVKVVLKGEQAKGFDEYECHDDCPLL